MNSSHFCCATSGEQTAFNFSAHLVWHAWPHSYKKTVFRCQKCQRKRKVNGRTRVRLSICQLGKKNLTCANLGFIQFPTVTFAIVTPIRTYEFRKCLKFVQRWPIICISRKSGVLWAGVTSCSRSWLFFFCDFFLWFFFVIFFSDFFCKEFDFFLWFLCLWFFFVRNLIFFFRERWDQLVIFVKKGKNFFSKLYF